MARIKANDTVVVLAGKDKGKHGSVLQLVDNEYVVVEGVNKIKKHKKPNPQQGIQGGIVEQEKALHISNVAILNQQTNKPDRIRYQLNDQGKKVRVFASNGELVDI